MASLALNFDISMRCQPKEAPAISYARTSPPRIYTEEEREREVYVKRTIISMQKTVASFIVPRELHTLEIDVGYIYTRQQQQIANWTVRFDRNA